MPSSLDQEPATPLVAGSEDMLPVLGRLGGILTRLKSIAAHRHTVRRKLINRPSLTVRACSIPACLDGTIL